MASRVAAIFLIGLTLAVAYGMWPVIQTLAQNVQR
jgi:hypothetical protein